MSNRGRGKQSGGAPPATAHSAPAHGYSPPAPAQSAATESLKFKFLEVQVLYFMSQMTLGDGKAAGIIAFGVAISAITVERLKDVRSLTLTVSSAIAVLALTFSMLGCAFAFQAIWPRRISKVPGGNVNVFSWVNVARVGASPGAYHSMLLDASDTQLMRSMAEVAAELASIVIRKYVANRRAIACLAPATILHAVFWLLR
jgi:hypothetical protein